MNKPRLRLIALLVVVVAILLVAAYGLARSGGASWFAAGVFVLVGSLTVAYGVVTLSPPRRRLRALPEGGVGLSNSPVLAVLLVSLVLGFFLVPVSLAVAWAASGDRPLTAAGPLVLLIVSVCGLLPVGAGLVRGRYRLGGLVLTPEAVAYTSFVRTHTLGWDQVGEVVANPTIARLELHPADRQLSAAASRRRSADRSTEAGPVEQLNVPTGLLRTDVEELRTLIDFYRTHPRDRHELLDSAFTSADQVRPSE